MSITKNLAESSLKNLHSEIFSLQPSTVIVLFEIDLSDILFDNGLIGEINEANEAERIFRFHNNIKLLNTSIIWQGKTYIAAPIKAENFELNARGTLPIPKLSIVSQSDGIVILAVLKNQINTLGDIIGARVTRRRTLLKYLDAANTFEGKLTIPNPSPDPNAEFPRDVYFIERKSFESGTHIEYELASILDIENVQLPNRLVLNSRCVWNYRGEGCLYESDALRDDDTHGTASLLPSSAPPIANEKDELIEEILDEVDGYTGGITPATPIKWDSNTNYLAGKYIYIEKGGIKYYFVARQDSIGQPPPDTRFWIADKCSKTIQGCKLRWSTLPDGTTSPGRLNGNPHSNALPFGGFPGTNKAEAGSINLL
ncbi:MAG: phage minor tail protein L [Nanoarchaeota archaeon]